MMKFLLTVIFLIIIATLAVNWWQKNSSAIAAEEIKRYARNMVTNPEVLSVKAEGIKIANKNSALINKVSISGNDVVLKNNLKLSEFSLVLNDSSFNIPIVSSLSSVKSGNFKILASESALTDYMRKRNINIGIWKVSADNIVVKITKDNYMQLLIPVVIPIIAKSSTIDIKGLLKNENDAINFIPEKLTVSGMQISSNQSTQLFNAIKLINPIIDLQKIPFTLKNIQLLTANKNLTIKGNITGVR